MAAGSKVRIKWNYICTLRTRVLLRTFHVGSTIASEYILK